jgi:prephenate dehydrogenase
VSERATVAVLGLGSLGAPLALALKQAGRFAQVVAWDADFDRARSGQRAAIADRFAGSAAEAVRQAAAVFLAVPHEALRDVLVVTGPHLSPGTVVCALDESQERASALAAEVLPASVSFVAAHPVLWERAPAGAAPAGAAPAGAVFRGSVLCLAPAISAHPDAVAYLSSLAEALGMEPFFVDAREHDAFASGILRLPSVLAAAYVRVTGRAGSWRELGRIAGGEYRHIGSLTDLDAAAGQGAMASTREHLVRWLDEMVAELSALRDGLQDGREPADFYAAAGEIWRAWLVRRQQPPELADLPQPPPAPRRRFPF